MADGYPVNFNIKQALRGVGNGVLFRYGNMASTAKYCDSVFGDLEEFEMRCEHVNDCLL
jgi:hypothetical protein